MVSDEIIKAILSDLHLTIAETASSTMAFIAGEKPEYQISYPLNESLTGEEKLALQQLASSPQLLSGIRKLLCDASTTPLFRLFCLMDGVGEPTTIPEWYGLSLVEKEEEDTRMLHDYFFESYWDSQQPN